MGKLVYGVRPDNHGNEKENDDKVYLYPISCNRNFGFYMFKLFFCQKNTISSSRRDNTVVWFTTIYVINLNQIKNFGYNMVNLIPKEVLRLWFMVFNATFNNFSVISWWSVLLVEETWVPGKRHQPVPSHWQTLLHNVVSNKSRDSNSQL